MDAKKKSGRTSWLRRFLGLKDDDRRKDPTHDWFVLPPKSPWTPAGTSQTLTNQPPSPEREEEKD